MVGNVLILVLMEYSLTVVEILFNCDMTVLILVLMEYSLTLVMAVVYVFGILS